MRARLGLENVRVVRSRAEELQASFDFMLGRSVSAVPTFLGFSSHFLHKRGRERDVAENSGLFYIKGGLQR